MPRHNFSGTTYGRRLETDHALPTTYAQTLRTLIRYAVVLGILGLLIGISYQESAHKLTYAAASDGLRLQATLPLALVHGHVFTMGVLMPLALAGALVLALKAGGVGYYPRDGFVHVDTGRVRRW